MLLNQLPVKAINSMVIIEVRGTLSSLTFLYSLSLLTPLCLLCIFLFTLSWKTESIFAFLDTEQSELAIHLVKQIYKVPTMFQVSSRCWGYSNEYSHKVTSHCLHGDYGLVGKLTWNKYILINLNYKLKSFDCKA